MTGSYRISAKQHKLLAKDLNDCRKVQSSENNSRYEEPVRLDADLDACKSFSKAMKRRMQFARQKARAMERLNERIGNIEAMLRGEIPVENWNDIPF